MKYGNLFLYLAMLAIIAGVFSTSAYSQIKEGKIPITTSSEEARKLFLKGLNLADKLRFQEAREYFEKAVAMDPDFAWAQLNLTFTQPTTKDFLASLDRAVALADKASPGERLLILASQAASHAETAKQEKYLQKLAATYPADERAQSQLGTFYMGLQDYPKAIEYYNKALAIEPNFSTPYNQLGYAYRFTGDYEQAEKSFKKYIELIPDDPNPYDSYAELLMEMGKFEKSIASYRKALEVNPNFPPSYIGMATDYNLMGNHQAARDELKKFLDIAVTDGQKRAALFAQAVSFADEGNLPGAMLSIKKQYGIAEKVNDVSSMSADLNTMGTISMEMGQYEDAQAQFDKALQIIEASNLAPELKDNSRRAHLYNTAQVDIKQGRIQMARDKAKKHLALSTDLGNVFQVRLSHELAGMVALAEQDYDTAVKELKQANLQNPYNQFRLAQAFQAAGQSDYCRKHCDKAAHYNALNNLNYAFIRGRAERMLAAL